MKRLLIYIAIVLAGSSVHGQIIEQCPDPTMVVLAGVCESACVVCDLDNYTGTNATIELGEAPSGFCAGSLHNTQWVGFVAGSADVTLEIDVFDCEFDYDNDTFFEGLQIGIYQTTDCNNFVSAFNCEDQVFDNETGVFTNTNPLTIGGIYFLVLDGAFGDICSFTVRVTNGSTVAPEVDPVAPNIVAGSQICRGGILNVAVDPPIFGAGAYYWTLNGADAGTDLSTAIQFPTEVGFYELCVTPYNPCSDGIQACVEVEVVPAVIEPLAETICEGDTLNFEGVGYTEDAVYNIHVPVVDDCDEYYQLSLDVIPTAATFLEEEICVNSIFEVGSEVFDSSGDYTVLLVSELSGCDSVVYLDLNVVGPEDTIRLNEIICYGDVYFIGEDTLRESGTYFYDLQDEFGCDSLINLNLEILPAPEGMVDATICIGESYSFNGEEYTLAGTYPVDIPLANGCDSLAILQLEVLLNDTTMLNEYICEGQAYLLGNESYTMAGSYEVPFPAANGCDSIVMLELAVVAPVVTVDSVQICEGDTITVDNNTYETTGTYDHPYLLPNGCDSIYRLVLDVVAPLTQTLDVIICAEAIFNLGGESFDSTGIYMVTTPAPNGCDSLYTLNLTVAEPLFSSGNISLCAEDTYTFSDTTLSTTGVYEFLLTATDGCDSLVTINLQFDEPIVTNLEETICSGDVYPLGDDFFDSSGDYTRVLMAANGCDSTVNLQLTVTPAPVGTAIIDICEGEEYWFNGQLYSETGFYTDTLSTLAGCDSIDQLILTIIPHTTNTIAPSVCAGGSYAIADTLLRDAGSYIFIFPSSAGCDSILTVMLSLEDTIVEALDIRICEGESYSVSSESYDETGFYETLLSTPEGCDSLVQLDLTVVPADFIQLTESICIGENYEVGDTSYANTGVFTTMLINSTTGCDSIVELDLTVVSVVETFLDEAICEDETFMVGTAIFTETGSYTTMLQSLTTGCDSIVYLELRVNETASTQLSEQICTGESYALGGMNYTTTGIYEAILSTTEGCDSTVLLDLYVAPCELTLTTAISNNSCAGDTSGEITLNLLVGTPPYNVNWLSNENGLSGSETIPSNNGAFTIGSLPAASYTININDVNDVDTTFVVMVAEPNELSLILDVSDYGGFQLSCAEEADGYLQANVMGGTPPYNYSWSEGSTTANIEQLAAGAYQLTVSDANDCQITASASLMAPDLLLGELETSPVNCITPSSGVIKVGAVSGGAPPYLYALNGSAYSSESLFAGLPVGEYTLNIQDVNGCNWAVETAIAPAPAFVIDAGEDEEMAFGDNLRLGAMPVDPLINYQWSGGPIMDCDTCATPLVAPEETTLYHLLATDENGCTAEDVVTVFVTKLNEVFIPNAFSPDGDGFNDRFRIYGGKQLIRISTLRIFDRWGVLVYQENDLSSGEETRAWDGQFQGQPMPSGVYVYIAEVLFLDGSTEVLGGEVLLLR